MLLHNEDNVPKISPMKISPAACKRYIKAVINRQMKAEKLFSNHRSIKVYYEDIVADGDSTLNILQEFLQVPGFDLTTTTQKIVKQPLSSLILNYDEVISYLSECGYEKHL